MRDALPVILTLCIAATACGRADADRAMKRLQDEYAAGIAPGETIAEARGRVPTLHFPSGGSTNYQDTSATLADGFSVIILRADRPGYDSPPADETVIRRVHVSAIEAPGAGQGTAARITDILGKRPTEGCMMTPSGTALTSAKYWTAGSGGVVLETPLKSRSWTARLTFFRGRWDAENVLGLPFARDCPRADGVDG